MMTERDVSQIEANVNKALLDASNEILDHHDSVHVLSLARASKELVERRFILKQMRHS